MKKVRENLHRVAKVAAQHVVPTEGNNHIPYLLRGSYLLFATGLVIVVLAGVVWGIPLSRKLNLTAEVYSSVLVDLTNSARSNNSVPTLSVSPTLQRAALLKAKDMAAKDYFAHTSPEGLTPWYWFDQVGYKFAYAGENLAVNFSETSDVENALLASPTHRANILDRHFTEIGIATFPGTHNGVPTTFVVESFGTPSLAKLAVATATTSTAPKKAPTIAVTSTPTTTNVLGEASPVPSPTKPLVKPTPARPIAKVTPVKVIYEDTQTAVAQNATPETELPGVVPDAKPVTVSYWYERFLMNPGPTTTAALLVLALLIGLATLAMAIHEAARHHRKHIILGSAFVIFILLLVSLAQQYVFPALNVIK